MISRCWIFCHSQTIRNDGERARRRLHRGQLQLGHQRVLLVRVQVGIPCLYYRPRIFCCTSRAACVLRRVCRRRRRFSRQHSATGLIILLFCGKVMVLVRCCRRAVAVSWPAQQSNRACMRCFFFYMNWEGVNILK